MRASTCAGFLFFWKQIDFLGQTYSTTSDFLLSSFTPKPTRLPVFWLEITLFNKRSDIGQKIAILHFLGHKSQKVSPILMANIEKYFFFKCALFSDFLVPHKNHQNGRYPCDQTLFFSKKIYIFQITPYFWNCWALRARGQGLGMALKLGNWHKSHFYD